MGSTGKDRKVKASSSEADTEPKYARALADAEDKIRPRRREYAYAFSVDGDVVLDGKTSGKKDSVSFTDEEIKKMFGAVVTHNHPSGSGLSIQDLVTFETQGFKEIRAVGSTGTTYVLTRVGDPVKYRDPKLAKAYDRARNEYKRTVVNPIFASTYDADRCNKMMAEFKTKWLTEHAGKYGCSYKEIKAG